MPVLGAHGRGLHGNHVGIKGPHQPVERRVVDHVVHDLVQGLPDPVQTDPADAQHAVGQLAQPLRPAQVGMGGGVAEGQRLLLEVGGQALQAGDQDQAGGLELLGQGAGQGQGPGLHHLRGRQQFRWDPRSASERGVADPYLGVVTRLWGWTAGPPQRAQLDVLPAVLDLGQTGFSGLEPVTEEREGARTDQVRGGLQLRHQPAASPPGLQDLGHGSAVGPLPEPGREAFQTHVVARRRRRIPALEGLGLQL